MSGWMDFYLKEKIKALKGDFKWWKKKVFGDLNRRIKLQMKFLRDLDLKAHNAPLYVDDNTLVLGTIVLFP